jgi:hypothetical protein
MLNEYLDAPEEMFQVTVIVSADLLSLQRSHEAFAAGVVIRITGATHARYHSVGSKYLHVASASVLYAPIGMMDEPWRRLSISNRLF